mgnify:CR=1 FL=1
MHSWLTLEAPTCDWADRDVIAERGAPHDASYVLVEGAVAIVHRGEDGTSVVVKILGAPTLFGVLEAVTDAPMWLESVHAIGAAKGLRLSKAAFRAHLDDNAASKECLVDLAHAFAVSASYETAHLASSTSKLAALLLAVGDVASEAYNTDRKLSIKRTQADWAAMAGVSERTVHTCFRRWMADGVVGRDEGRVVLLRRDALLDEAGELARALVHTYPLDKTGRR